MRFGLGPCVAALGMGCALTAVPRSTQPQPCIILSGSLNRVPASAGVRAEMCDLHVYCWWQETLCDSS